MVWAVNWCARPRIFLRLSSLVGEGRVQYMYVAYSHVGGTKRPTYGREREKPWPTYHLYELLCIFYVYIHNGMMCMLKSDRPMLAYNPRVIPWIKARWGSEGAPRRKARERRIVKELPLFLSSLYTSPLSFALLLPFCFILWSLNVSSPHGDLSLGGEQLASTETRVPNA